MAHTEGHGVHANVAFSYRSVGDCESRKVIVRDGPKCLVVGELRADRLAEDDEELLVAFDPAVPQHLDGQRFGHRTGREGEGLAHGHIVPVGDGRSAVEGRDVDGHGVRHRWRQVHRENEVPMSDIAFRDARVVDREERKAPRARWLVDP